MATFPFLAHLKPDISCVMKQPENVENNIDYYMPKLSGKDRFSYNNYSSGFSGVC